MTIRNFDYVIIGGGLAGTTAAESLRNEGAKGSIAIVSNEERYPYQRPPLSKRSLQGEDAPQPRYILDASLFDSLDITVLLHSPVKSIDSSKHLIEIDAENTIRYKKLLIASGSKPVALNVPGSDLEGIHYLHSFSDVESIHAGLTKDLSVVVVGGSFIGLEVAASLSQKGVRVTLIERETLLSQLKIPEVSNYFVDLFKRHGVQVVTHDSPTQFAGNNKVQEVLTAQGKRYPCEMVIVGAGVVPDVGFLEGSGIKFDDGVLVDQFLQSNRANIFAAGDVANFYDPIFGCRQRIQHWDNAIKQGRVAAKNMLGKKVAYEEVPYFYSDVFHISFNLLGLEQEPCERISRGSLESGSFALFFLRNDIPVALFSLGRPSEETKVMEALIKHKVNLGEVKSKLGDPHFSLSHIPTQNIFILQGGGAFGAFECGAIHALTEASILPNIVAGVSIGAFNGAIIAGNPHNPAEALEAFWAELMVSTPPAASESLRQLQACNQIATFGVPNFFQPRWLMPFAGLNQMPSQWTNLYDTAPMKKLLEKYVDFRKLKSSPIRLLISAVDIETSELVIFDSYERDLGPEHIMASGSLPPAFPWTTIDGRHYWDGGIVSNSPLERVIDRCGSEGKRVYIIDLFPGERASLPDNLLDVMSRRDEILYSERIRTDLRTKDMIRSFQSLVDEMLSEMPPEKVNQIKHRPGYIQLVADELPMKITRILRNPGEDEVHSKDYDFSEVTIRKLQRMGYDATMKAIARE